jgi:hypothetical protein
MSTVCKPNSYLHLVAQSKFKELEEQLAAKVKECDAASTDLKKWMTAAKLLKKQNKEMEAQIKTLSEANAKRQEAAAASASTASAAEVAGEAAFKGDAWDWGSDDKPKPKVIFVFFCGVVHF